MSVKILLAGILGMGQILGAQVFINELYYDHPGSDDGHEWVELYNAGPAEIGLNGWIIEKAGSEFEPVFVFSDIYIGSQQFLVIGEAEVTQADLTAVLVFQNGGSATDGVRIISADGMSSDTVLYDEPNSNGLPDDLGNTGSSFAPDVEAGYSLIRVIDGLDTNSGEDWQASHYPTPGAANIISIDLAIQDVTLYESDGHIWLSTEVENLSTGHVDNSAGSLDIYYNNTPYESIILGAIGGGESVEKTVVLPIIQNGYHQVELFLNSLYDSNLANNTGGSSLQKGLSMVVLNELLINPPEGGCEWVELSTSGNVDNYVDNLYIRDAAGGRSGFASSSLLTGYQVICDEPVYLMGEYDLSLEQVIETANLPGLNNSGDTIWLEDKWGTILDSVAYGSGAGLLMGVSWERMNPYSAVSGWGLCIAAEGETAGAENSILSGMIDLELIFEGINETGQFLQHQMLIINRGIQLPEEADLIVTQTNLTDGSETEQTEYIAITADSIDVMVTTSKPECGCYRFGYELLVAGDSNLSDNQAESSYSLNSLGWVINEIMYRPAAGEPEWLEIKRNAGNTETAELVVVVKDDSCQISVNGEYAVITASEADKETIEEAYGCECEIFTGLARLTDAGVLIGLKDVNGSLYEEFCYDPDWNQGLAGVSIERVNPLLPAREDNWSRCVGNHTAGRENSVYTELPMQSHKLSVTPGVFAPIKGEHAVISYSNSSNLNLVKIEIFDLKGRLVRKLADQKYQSQEGMYLWDGRNERGSIVPRGIYVILFESSGSGEIYVEKASVVVKR